MTNTSQQRFWSRVMPEPMSGCWLWDGRWQTGGYGQFRVTNSRPKDPVAHRYSWELHRGPIPQGFDVLHKCDVRCCVNPDHLYLGTDVDNQRDRNQRKGLGSRPRGEKHGRTQLTEEDVKEIRASPLSLKRTGRRYGISDVQVLRIRRRENWKHI